MQICTFDVTLLTFICLFLFYLQLLNYDGSNVLLKLILISIVLSSLTAHTYTHSLLLVALCSCSVYGTESNFAFLHRKRMNDIYAYSISCMFLTFSLLFSFVYGLLRSILSLSYEQIHVQRPTNTCNTQRTAVRTHIVAADYRQSMHCIVANIDRLIEICTDGASLKSDSNQCQLKKLCQTKETNANEDNLFIDLLYTYK